MSKIFWIHAVILIFCFIGGIGWAKNFTKLADCDFEAPYKCEVIRVAGIIPPIGAVIGWYDLDIGK